MRCKVAECLRFYGIHYSSTCDFNPFDGCTPECEHIASCQNKFQMQTLAFECPSPSISTWTFRIYVYLAIHIWLAVISVLRHRFIPARSFCLTTWNIHTHERACRYPNLHIEGNEIHIHFHALTVTASNRTPSAPAYNHHSDRDEARGYETIKHAATIIAWSIPANFLLIFFLLPFGSRIARHTVLSVLLLVDERTKSQT